eukprot:766752-Hanusia_phi.AAC.16
MAANPPRAMRRRIAVLIQPGHSTLRWRGNLLRKQAGEDGGGKVLAESEGDQEDQGHCPERVVACIIVLEVVQEEVDGPHDSESDLLTLTRQQTRLFMQSAHQNAVIHRSEAGLGLGSSCGHLSELPERSNFLHRIKHMIPLIFKLLLCYHTSRSVTILYQLPFTIDMEQWEAA